jgi:hypothetical protein
MVWVLEKLNVSRTRDAMDMNQIADLVRRLSTAGILGSTAIAQEAASLDKTNSTLLVYANRVSARDKNRVYAP